MGCRLWSLGTACALFLFCWDVIVIVWRVEGCARVGWICAVHASVLEVGNKESCALRLDAAA